jgi:ribosomal protein L40E
LDERPRGVTLIAIADGVLGLLVFTIGVLCLGLIPLNSSLEKAIQMVIPPSSFYDTQFGWVSIVFGVSLIVGALGLSRMTGWGYFMVLLNRFLVAILCLAYINLQMLYFILGFVVPTMLIITYLIRSRWFFFEPEVPEVQPKKEEVAVPELPSKLTMPSEKVVKAEEIRKVLSTPRSVPKTCPNCGEENSIEAIVCYRCGMNLKTSSVEVPGSPKPEPQTSRKVADAPQKQMIFCIYCGTKNPSKAEYCFRCGKKIWRG